MLVRAGLASGTWGRAVLKQNWAGVVGPSALPLPILRTSKPAVHYGISMQRIPYAGTYIYTVYENIHFSLGAWQSLNYELSMYGGKAA